MNVQVLTSLLKVKLKISTRTIIFINKKHSDINMAIGRLGRNSDGGGGRDKAKGARGGSLHLHMLEGEILAPR